jgi:GT2 family glycosyltransferase
MLSSSIVITTYNRRSDLHCTLQTLQHLDPRPLETIVILDGCKDGSREMLETEFPHITIVEHETQQGSIPARDTGFRMTRGDIIVSLDDDSAPLEMDFLSRISRLAEQHPEAGAFAFQEVRESWPRGPRKINEVSAPQYVTLYPNCAAAMRRELYGGCVSYPRFFVHMYEEPDCCLQAYAAGFAVWYEPTIKVLHRASPVQRHEKSRHHFMAQNEFLSVLMRCPSPHVFWLAPYRAVRRFLYSCQQGPSWVLEEPRWWASAAFRVREALQQRKPVEWRIYRSWLTLPRRTLTSYEEMLECFPSVATRLSASLVNRNCFGKFPMR